MPTPNGRPMPGEEVLFPDGSTAVIRAYERRTVDGCEVVRMAQPFRQEYVTLGRWDEKVRFWLVAKPLVQTATSAPPASMRVPVGILVGMIVAAIFFIGLVLGWWAR